MYKAYEEDDLPCPVKCVCLYLALMLKISTENYTEVFITYGKPHQESNFIEMYIPYEKVQETYFENGFHKKKGFIKFC